jgi:hypothetical protein
VKRAAPYDVSVDAGLTPDGGYRLAATLHVLEPEPTGVAS